MAYYDGDYSTETQHGAIRISRPLAGVGQMEHLLAVQTIRVRNAFRRQLPSLFPLTYLNRSFVLVGESDGADLRGDIVEFNRTYITVPASWTDYEFYPVTYQYAQIVENENDVLSSVTITSNVKVTRDYFATTEPQTISLKRKRVGFLIAGKLQISGDTANLAEDDRLQRYLGDVWVRERRELVTNELISLFTS